MSHRTTVTLLSIAAPVLMMACTLSGLAAPPAPPPTSAPTAASAGAAQATNIPAAPTAVPPTPVSPIPISAQTAARLTLVATHAPGDLVRSVAFSPDGTVLAAALGDMAGSIRLFDTATDVALGTLQGHESIVWDVAFSPDGRYLASASKDRTARVWDWRGKAEVTSIPFADEVTSVAFSPDGRSLAVGGVDGWPNAAIWMVAVDTWQPALKLAEFWNIPAIVYSPDGTHVVGGGTSRNVRSWDTSDGRELHILSHAGQVTSLALSPDGTLLAAGLCERSDGAQCQAGAIWLWDPASGRLLRKITEFPDVVEAVAFTTDGSIVLGGSRDGSLRAFDASEGTTLFSRTSSPAALTASILALAISPDGALLAVGGQGGIALWGVAP